MYTPAQAELNAFLSSKEGQEAYLLWIANPITQRVIAAGREIARPRFASSQDCAIAYGESIGANTVLDFLVNPRGRAADKMQGIMPQARYGVKTKEIEDAK